MNSGDLNLLELIIHASLPVQMVMALLIGASIWSWWIIFRKKAVIAHASKTANEFEELHELQVAGRAKRGKEVGDG